MGKPIAANILKAGFDLVVTDLRDGPVRDLVERGAGAADSPREVAAGADIVLASLPTNAASERVGAEVVSSVKAGGIYVDLSTITPAVIERIADQGREKGVEVLDAPVSGEIVKREEGTLAVMIGGDAATVARARPVFEAFGREIHHVGGVGAGAAMKLINNLTMATNMVAAMEALVLGVKAGLEPETVRTVIGASSGNSAMFRSMVDKLLSTSCEPDASGPRQGFRLVVKDTQLAAAFAEELSVPLLAGAATVQAFVAGNARGLADKEIWALIEVFEALAGVRVRPPGL